MARLRTPALRVLELEVNQLGDVFCRSMKDLFMALGYEHARENVHKTGRELDLEGAHRTEQRRFLAECKCTAEKSGGADLNKFAGVLQVERAKSPGMVGYFVSVAGFAESAVEQEGEVTPARMVLLDGTRIVDELVKGRIIVDLASAVDAASRLIPRDSKLRIREAEVVISKIGWVWAVYFQDGGALASVALVHADGTVLGNHAAKPILEFLRKTEGSLSLLAAQTEENASRNRQLVKEAYYRYLATECGNIRFEGLPTDRELGGRQIPLEEIFVPMHLNHVDASESAPSAEDDDDDEPDFPVDRRQPVGGVLSQHSKIALLGPPGSGKSTLLKRLAVAYAFPERRALSGDALPNAGYVPLFIRCRQIDFSGKPSIRAILESLVAKAELENFDRPFSEMISEALQSGNALLLIDGLDEIPNQKQRLEFVLQLRTFLATYPAVSMVLTSREYGFRVVGGALSMVCHQFKLAEFSVKDIERLVHSWLSEVVGQKAGLQIEAEKLAREITGSSRVFQLARNPLLLTTLLLVRRWLGQLPTKRSVLYSKAIEVLLMTWNVEGHDPLDADEVLPQLEYVAHDMMRRGLQRIGHSDLLGILREAREEMPELLSFSKFSAAQLVEEVESRSALLTLTGHEVQGGELQAVYEFTHLTFQEFLAARGTVNGHYPGRREEDTLLGQLKPLIGNQNWREVIPLTLIMAGRDAKPVIDYLIQLTQPAVNRSLRGDQESIEEDPAAGPATFLARALADEVPLVLESVMLAVNRVLENVSAIRGAHLRHAPDDVLVSISQGKYGKVLVEKLDTAFAEGPTGARHFLDLGSPLAQITFDQLRAAFPDGAQFWQEVVRMMRSDSTSIKAKGILAAMMGAFREHSSVHSIAATESAKGPRDNAGIELTTLIDHPAMAVRVSAVWAITWFSQNRVFLFPESVCKDLIAVWDRGGHEDLEYLCTWALTLVPLPARDDFALKLSQTAADRLKKLRGVSQGKVGVRTKLGLAVIAYFARIWPDDQLVEVLVSKQRPSRHLMGTGAFRDLMGRLGPVGQGVLAEEEKRKAARRQRKPAARSP